MNRYHATHPSLHCKAIGSGHSSADAYAVAQQKEKEQRRSASAMLQALGGQQVKGSKFTGKVNSKQAQKRTRSMQRTGGQRGS